MVSRIPYNEEALDAFVRSSVSPSMIKHLARKAQEVIKCEPFGADSSPMPPTPPSTPPNDGSARKSPVSPPSPTNIPTLEAFITSLCTSSNVQVSTLMTTLLYLDRLKATLPPVAKGLPCTVHRIFLACLILSAKFLNDSSPKNKHWAIYSHVSDGFGFSKTEVNLMEKQLLFLLDWNLNFTPSDLEEHFEVFLAPIRRDMEQMDLYKRAEREKRRAREVKLEQQRLQLQEHTRQLGYATAIPMPAPRSSKPRPSDVYAQPKQGPYTRSHASRQPYYHEPAYPSPRYASATSSPPAASDVPALSRSGTEESISYRAPSSNYSSQSRASSQERASVRSVSTTPSSSVSNLSINQNYNYYLQEPLLSSDELYTDLYGASSVWRAGCGASLESTVDIADANDFHLVNGNMPHSVMSSPKQQQKRGMRSFAGYNGELPTEVKAPAAKKAKFGGFMNRFRSTAEA